MNKFTKNYSIEIVFQFVVQLVGINGLVLASQLTRLIDVLSQFGLNIENILLPLIFLVVTFLPLTIPLAFLFALVIVLNSSNLSGEIAGARSLGLSPVRFVGPIILIGLLLSVVGSVSGMYLDPWGQKEFRRFFIKKTQTKLDSMIKVQLKPRVFTDKFINHVFYSEEVDKDRLAFQNLMLAPLKKSKISFVLFAPKGQLIGSVETGSLIFNFKDARTYSFDPLSKNFSVSKSKELNVDLLSLFQDEILGKSGSLSYLTYFPGELNQFRKAKKSKFETLRKLKKVNTKKLNDVRADYLESNYMFHFRIGGAFIALGFAFLGWFIASRENSREKSSTFGKIIILVMLTYFLITGARWAAENGYIHAGLAVWGTNLVVLVPGVLLLWRAQRKIIG